MITKRLCFKSNRFLQVFYVKIYQLSLLEYWSIFYQLTRVVIQIMLTLKHYLIKLLILMISILMMFLTGKILRSQTWTSKDFILKKGWNNRKILIMIQIKTMMIQTKFRCQQIGKKIGDLKVSNFLLKTKSNFIKYHNYICRQQI